MAASASAQIDFASAERGHEIARSVCANCHLVKAGDERDLKMKELTFREIANREATTEMSLRAFLRAQHRDMPNLMLPEQDTADIIAYILSLK